MEDREVGIEEGLMLLFIVRSTSESLEVLSPNLEGRGSVSKEQWPLCLCCARDSEQGLVRDKALFQ